MAEGVFRFSRCLSTDFPDPAQEGPCNANAGPWQCRSVQPGVRIPPSDQFYILEFCLYRNQTQVRMPKRGF